MILVSIFNKEIDIFIVVTFLLGILSGIILMALIYVFLVIKTLRQKTKFKKVDEVNIDEEEIKWLIKDSQKQFIKTKKESEDSFSKNLINVCKDLSYNIAAKFYPKSKYPYLELTIDESILLSNYILERVNTLLEYPLIKPFRGTTLSTIVTLTSNAKKINESKVAKAVKKSSPFINIIKSGLNAVNPVYWVKKGVIDNISNFILTKIAVAIISITGEETYKVYSKKVFNQDTELETDVNEIYEEIKSKQKENQDDI